MTPLGFETLYWLTYGGQKPIFYKYTGSKITSRVSKLVVKNHHDEACENTTGEALTDFFEPKHTCVAKSSSRLRRSVEINK